ncbi:MAG: hypothetical protein DRO40_04410 [Thermoprotei archaeon]|nr:MAG: hypothetical protein DRO40_04410 [Thermoprotei archaeon]
MNNSLNKIISILKRLGVDERTIDKFIEGASLKDEETAWIIFNELKRMRGSRIVFEDEIGGLFREPVYAAIIAIDEILACYFSSPSLHYIKLRHLTELNKMVNELRNLMEEYARRRDGM